MYIESKENWLTIEELHNGNHLVYAKSCQVKQGEMTSEISYQIDENDNELIEIHFYNFESAIPNNVNLQFFESYNCRCIFDKLDPIYLNFKTTINKPIISFQLTPESIAVFRTYLMECETLKFAIFPSDKMFLEMNFSLANSQESIKKVMSKNNFNNYSTQSSTWQLLSIGYPIVSKYLSGTVEFVDRLYPTKAPILVISKYKDKSIFTIDCKHFTNINFKVFNSYLTYELFIFKITVDNNEPMKLRFKKTRFFNDFVMEDTSESKLLFEILRNGKSLMIEVNDHRGSKIEFQYNLKGFKFLYDEACKLFKKN